MAFHERKAVTVVLIDRPADDTPPIERRPGRTQTWLYDATTDAWSELTGAELSFSCGMNYNLHYDAIHDLLLLVAEDPTAVWALKLP